MSSDQHRRTEDQSPSVAIPRHKTAIRRGGHSRPVALAKMHGLIGAGSSVLDYGCGLGEDVALLKESGATVEGWDPYYRPDTDLTPADCVNLGYVLNVIENPREREETLLQAFDLARRVLVVAVRVDQSLVGGTDFADGLVTNRGSFQKIYTQAEFREYLQTTLKRKPYMAGLGIAYVFRDEAIESSFLADRSIRPDRQQHLDWYAEFASDPGAGALIELTRELGRIPLDSEFGGYEELRLRFGSRSRIERLVFGNLNPESIAVSKTRKRNDILTYLAMLQLRGLKPPPIRLLPTETQADIKLIWRSYAKAVEEGREFLFQLGKPEMIRGACLAAAIGKRLPTDLYIHRRAERSLPALLRVLLFAAGQIVGDVEYDIVKVAIDGRKVSFLKYQRFDEDAHPALQLSVRVDLPKTSYAIRDYGLSENPPILHRKDALVDPLDPAYAIFAALTEQEEALGLLEQPTIGFQKQWQDLLQQRDIEIVDHSIRPRVYGIPSTDQV